MSTLENLTKKAQDAQLVFEQLVNRYGIKPVPTTFIADPSKKELFENYSASNMLFSGPVGENLTGKRDDGIAKLFKEEKILQSAGIAGVLAASSSVASEIAALRGADISKSETYCDLAFAGMQAIRLFVADTTGKEFEKVRLGSAISVNNAFNGIFFKYKTADNRDFSYHVYYQSQQVKLAKALGAKKPSAEYNTMTIPEDIAELTEITKKHNSAELEELSFDCGACGSIVRSREEWEATEVGKAVCAQPLIDEVKYGEGNKPNWGMPNELGPLSGIKVLDLTHIIAGPACSRVLSNYGADVLLVRRGKYIEQEQAMTELDGWAGKHSIQLDFNNPDELARCKELVKEADVIVYSYQNGAMDKFGLSEDDIRELNPNVIYANLNCFSETVWRHRPGWAPCAEDMTGLAVRNGTMEKPVNLNGVPLDYFPGFILGLGTLLAIKHRLENGGGYKVTTSLTRGAQYLHEITDLCEDPTTPAPTLSKVVNHHDDPTWMNVTDPISDVATGGEILFPGPATINTAFPRNMKNLAFSDGNTGWRQ